MFKLVAEIPLQLRKKLLIKFFIYYTLVGVFFHSKIQKFLKIISLIFFFITNRVWN